MKPELTLGEISMRMADLGEEAGLPDLVGETVLQNQLSFCLGEEDEIFEGYGRRQNAFPYRQLNGYGRRLREGRTRTAVLENAYLKAVFLPSFGGRLWSLTDKQTGRELLYTNSVLRFCNLAVRNAWFSGGVEWNIGVIGHSPLTAQPLYLAETQTPKGEPVLRLYEYERVRRLFYQMDFWLEEESPYLNCRMRVVNDTKQVTPMYWWSNIAVPEYEGGRIVVPAERAFTFKDGSVYKTEIPYVDGVDITAYQTIPKSVDYFFDIKENEPKYIANLDAEGYGLLQVSTGRLRSRKLFSWGNGEASDHWQEFLTEYPDDPYHMVSPDRSDCPDHTDSPDRSGCQDHTDSPDRSHGLGRTGCSERAGRYIEVQAGLGKTQYGCLPMAPHTAWEWMEQYGAVRIEKTLMRGTHEKRRSVLTQKLQEEGRSEELEKKLAETKAMAQTAADTFACGSGYGALEKERRFSGHLTFELQADSLRRWKAFLESGKLHEPAPEERPDEFWSVPEVFEQLKRTIQKENRDNWYAHYQLGICYYDREAYEQAQEQWRESLRLAENAWAYHGLACAKLRAGTGEEAAALMRKGLRLRDNDLSYLKEGFGILYACGRDREILSVYETLSSALRENSRLRFYEIGALHRQGEDRKAYELLEADGGLELEDIREGEDSLETLWKELYQALYGKKPEKVPHRYCFRAI